MPRRPVWPPRPFVRRNTEYLKLPTPGGYREVTLGPAGSAQARQEYARLLAEIAANGGRVPLQGAPSIGLAIVEHLELRAATEERATHSRRSKALGVVYRLYGTLPLAAFGTRAFRTVRVELEGEGHSKPYVDALMQMVRSWLKFCVAEQLVGPDNLAAIREETAPRGKRSKRQPVDLAVVEATLPFLPWPVDAMVRLQMLTGMRPVEVCRIRGCDVERDWMVCDGVGVWLYTPFLHKSQWRGLQRGIPLGPQAQQVLLPFLDRSPEAFCFSPRESIRWQGRQRRQGTANPGREPNATARVVRDHYSTEVFGRVVKRTIELHGLPKFTLYQIRHRKATDLFTMGSVEDAQAALGHESVDMTLEYTKMLMRAAKLAARLG